MNLRRKIFLTLMIIMMICIFLFSSRTADESTDDSYLVGRLVSELFVPGFEEWSAEDQQAFIEKIDHPVRKTAHATEYAVLAMLAAGAYFPACIERDPGEIRGGMADIPRNNRKRRALFSAWLTASAYAATDEFHQLFVPGRSGQISDVILDSAGALAGVVIAVAVLTAVCRIRSAGKHAGGWENVADSIK
jgi:VanZ family protein